MARTPKINTNFSKAREWEKWVFPTTPHSSEKTYTQIVNLIENNIPFSFLRMGDGDLKAYLNIPQTTILTEEYRKLYESSLDPIFELKEKTNTPKLIFGIENSTVCTNDIYKRNRPDSYKLDLFYKRFAHTDAASINSIVFMHMYVYHTLNDFFKSLQNRRVILVGPKYLEKIAIPCLEKFHIETTVTYSWEHQTSYEEQLISLLNSVDSPVIIYGCSVTGKMLLSKMFFLYENITQIDIGAALDPYAGIRSRPWHRSEIASEPPKNVSMLLCKSNARSNNISNFLQSFNEHVRLDIPKYYCDRNFALNPHTWKFLRVASNVWSDRLSSALIQIPTDYIVYIQEDFLAKSELTSPLIQNAINLINSNFLDCVYICKAHHGVAKMTTVSSVDNLPLNKFKENSNYIFSHQFAVWNRLALIDNLKEIRESTRHLSEINGTANIIRKGNQHKYQIIDYPWYSISNI